MIKSILFASLLIISSASASAQTYQWVKGGGSGSNIQNRHEKTTYLCTDANRNVYSLASVGDNNISADTFYRQQAYNTGGSYPLEHTLLCSYRCDGTMRWAKLLESGGYAIGYGVKYDGNGSVYIAMALPGVNKHIGDDSFSNSIYLQSCLIRYDTSGDFQWVRFVGPDNAVTGSNTGYYSTLAIDDQGYAHHFNYIHNGVPLTPGVTSQTGTYDLKYDGQGNIMSAIRLQGLDTSYYPESVSFAPSGKIYACMRTESYTLPNALLTSFSSNGTWLWSDTTNFYGGMYNPVFHNGSLYAGFASGGEPFTLKGQSFSNSYNVLFAETGIVKLDTSGNLKWLYKLDGTTGVAGALGLTMLQGDKIAITGVFAGKIRHMNDSLVVAAGQNPFLVIIDTSGNTIKLDQPASPGFYDWGTAITADNTGNLIYGGMVESTVTAGALTPYANSGGNEDFFIMKYGYDCNCAAPMAVFAKTLNNATYTATLTYNGVGGADSIRWDFGDGQFLTVSGGSIYTPLTHTYNTEGNYNICVMVYNSCGTNQSCQQLQVITGVGTVSALEQVSVYPNPAGDNVTIEGAKGTTVCLLSLLGTQVLSINIGEGSQSISLSAVPSGSYILMIRRIDGIRRAIRFTKQ